MDATPSVVPCSLCEGWGYFTAIADGPVVDGVQPVRAVAGPPSDYEIPVAGVVPCACHAGVIEEAWASAPMPPV